MDHPDCVCMNTFSVSQNIITKALPREKTSTVVAITITVMSKPVNGARGGEGG